MFKINFSIALLALLSVAQIAPAQTTAPTTDEIKATRQTPTWIAQDWDAEDAIYPAIGDEVAAELAKTSDKPSVVARYKEAWAANPGDADAFFRYASGKYATLPDGGQDLVGELNALAADFGKVAAPRTYLYSRLRFLVEARNFANPQLKPLVQRLIARDSEDLDVLYCSLHLWNVADAADQKQALDAIQTLTRLEPKRASTQAAAGWVGYRIWLVTKRKSDAQIAANYYKRYLQLAAPNDAFRPQAQALLDQLEKA